MGHQVQYNLRPQLMSIGIVRKSLLQSAGIQNESGPSTCSVPEVSRYCSFRCARESPAVAFKILALPYYTSEGEIFIRN